MHSCNCLDCPSPCVESGTKDIIHAKRILACVYSNSLPKGRLSDIMGFLQERVSYAQNTLGIIPQGKQTGAFNNARGHWLKWIFACIAWNIFVADPTTNNACFVMLPSTTSLDFVRIFDSEAQFVLKNGLLETLQNQNIEMTMSNPDFICVTDLPPETTEYFKKEITDLSMESQKVLDMSYKWILNSCSYSGLKFGVALKTSLRSDRRYQTAYEGSILKALIAHLQVRFWDISFDTKYYAVVADNVTKTDRCVLSAPATHSIVDVHTLPIKAIDEIYQVNSTEEMGQCILRMIRDSL